MAHVTTIDSPTVHGILAERKDGSITLALPGTDYRLLLIADTAPGSAIANAELNKPIAGTIHARAKRVDITTTGGRFIEPVFGRPRRLQGRIIATDPGQNAITIFCGAPVVCTLMPTQKAEQFEVGQLVGFDVEKGSHFESGGADH